MAEVELLLPLVYFLQVPGNETCFLFLLELIDLFFIRNNCLIFSSLGFSMSSVNDPATPSGAGPSIATAPKKSNWEVIEHYHKSGLHGVSSREKQQQVSNSLNRIRRINRKFL